MNKKKVCKIAGAAFAGALLASGTVFYGAQQSGIFGNNDLASGNKFAYQLGSQVNATKEPIQAEKVAVTEKNKITIHYKWKGSQPHLYYQVSGSNTQMSYPGVPMKDEGNGWFSYTVDDADAAEMKISVPELGYQTSEFARTEGEYWYADDKGWSETTPVDYVAPVEEKKTTSVTTALQAPEEEVSMDSSDVAKESEIILHFPGDWNKASIYFWNIMPEDQDVDWPGKTLQKDADGYYTYTISKATKANFLFTDGSQQTDDFSVKNAGEYWYADGKWTTDKPSSSEGGNSGNTTNPTTKPTAKPNKPVTPSVGGDFRDETIYFMMTTRFYDGDPSNNRYCWDGPKANKANNDPEWRGDFKGAAEKLDYIKALGFSAIWITPVVENASGYDYHGYHALDFSKVDERYESSDYTYQDFINDCHKNGIKVIQDIVLNHTGNWGETNLYPMFEKGEDDGEMSPAMVATTSEKLAAGAKLKGGEYDSLVPDNQYGARISAMKEDSIDTEKIYHHCKSLSWNGLECQLGQIAGDCVDLNTENPKVYNYLNECYDNYIKMGVDAFRVDTVKHISRLTFNKTFIPEFKKTGGNDFYIFGECCARYNEVWNERVVPISVCFYTWAEQDDWAWSDTDEAVNTDSATKHFGTYAAAQDSQPTSNNEILEGNTYHDPDYSKSSGFNMIDFMMHWGFRDANTAFGQGLTEDKYFNDSTWNVVYVDSHDYAPDNAPENQRFAGTQDTWAENLALMYTFRGIPCLYYGSEIEFKKGCPIDVGPNAALEETGRAYFGDHIEGSVNVTDYGVYSGATGAMAETLNYPLAKHIQRLNLIRRAVPALRKGQYSTADVSGSGMSFRRRYTANGEDSYALINLSGSATFTNVLNGTYVDVVSGDKVTVSNGTLTTGSVTKGNMRVYVLQNETASAYGADGKIGEDGTYLK